MKPKKLSKKLDLNKKTISNLNHDAMTVIKAGNLGTSEVDPTACQTYDGCTGDTVCASCVSCYLTCPVGVCRTDSCSPPLTFTCNC